MVTTDIRYDARRGRVRLRATALPVGSLLTRTFYRPANRLRAGLVRGGEVLVTSLAMARYVDDYEYTAGLDGFWTIEAYNSLTPTGPANVLYSSGEVKVTPPLSEGWLKFVASPFLNKRVLVVGWGDIERDPRTALYQIQDRPDPIAVSSVHSSRKVTVRLRADTIADRDALDASLAAGAPAFLHMPSGALLPSLYCSIGHVAIARGKSQRSTRTYFTVDLVEIAAPPPSIYGIADTWSTLRTENATWTAVGVAYDTWVSVVG